MGSRGPATGTTGLQDETFSGDNPRPPPPRHHLRPRQTRPNLQGTSPTDQKKEIHTRTDTWTSQVHLFPNSSLPNKLHRSSSHSSRPQDQKERIAAASYHQTIQHVIFSLYQIYTFYSSKKK